MRFGRAYARLSAALLLPPRDSFVEIGDGQVRVRMGWAFRASFPLAAIASATPSPLRPLSRGVHGLAGRWLVNGSGDGLVSVVLQPAQRARVMGLPVSLGELLVSAEEPERLVAALTTGPARGAPA
ncbi:MAG: hypothetical protein HZB56_03135 [Deltaproteobacteria bacterium]|nr:hypothetical protein [Deltaproteobacteria bacterium]